MAKGEIYIDGVIEMVGYDGWDSVTLSSVRNQVNALPDDTTELTVHINSVGGDVVAGFAIHDFLKGLEMTVTTVVTGLCASIATVIAQAGSIKLMTPNSEYMIHNPFMWAEGTADDIEAQAKFLRDTENKIVDFYVKNTDMNEDDLRLLMTAETWMSADEALAAGFITGVTESMSAKALEMQNRARNKQQFKAVALLQIPNPKQRTMSSTKKPSVLEALIARVKNTLTPTMKAYTLEGGEVINTDSEDDIAVGQVVTDAEGATLEAGSYVIESGETITVDEAGVVTSVEEVEEEQMAEANADALEVALQAIEKLAEAQQELLTSINEVKESAAANADALTRITNGSKPAARKVTPRPQPKAPEANGLGIKESAAAFKENHKRKVK